MHESEWRGWPVRSEKTKKGMDKVIITYKVKTRIDLLILQRILLISVCSVLAVDGII